MKVMAAGEFLNASGRTPAPPATTQHTASWHSPVPYLFGGLAAMFGLIAIALIILACSYLKLSSHPENGGAQQDRRDLEAGDGAEMASNSGKVPAVTDEKILVIMAGDAKPTFLATVASPLSGSSSNFITNSLGAGLNCSCGEKSQKP